MLEVMAGAVEVRTITVGGIEYKMAPLGPLLLGQIIGYVKDRKRTEIAASAKGMGGVTFEQLLESTEKELGKINEKTIGKFTKDLDIMSRLIFFSLRIHQPDMLYSDVGKIVTSDNLEKFVEVMMSDFTKKPEKE